MPGFDQTGPVGQGPKTGKGFGPCNGMAGRGLWNCRRGGFGFRKFFSSKNNLETLENEEKILEEELKAIREEKAGLKGQEE